MKLRNAFLGQFSLCLMLALPVLAGDAYDNGGVNGNTDAWNIAFNNVVSDTITCCKVLGDGASFGVITGFSGWFWEIPGDNLISAELSITSAPDGGISYFDQTLDFTKGSCLTNHFGFSVCQETASFGPYSLYLEAGNYWVNLQNAKTADNEPIYWDENSGVGCTSPGCPSQATDNMVGTIPSEAFSIQDNAGASSPEPSSIALFASGVLGSAVALRRTGSRR